MILTFDELPKLRGSVSMVDGAFDPLHAGHVEYFRAAAALGRPLLCNVASDRYVRTKHPPLLPDWQRAVIIDALRDVAYTHVNEHDTETVLEQLRPYAYVKGKDWEGRLPPRQVEICGRLGIRICFLDTVRDSSTRLLRAYAEGIQVGDALQQERIQVGDALQQEGIQVGDALQGVPHEQGVPDDSSEVHRK